MTSPLRVLVVEPLGRGGEWHYSVAFSSGLSEEGVDVFLATPFPYEPVPNCRPVPVLPIGKRLPGRSWSRRLLLQRLAYHFERLRRLQQIIKQLRPHIVHLQGPLGTLDFAYYWYAKLLGSRIVYTDHTDHNPVPLWHRVLERARYNQADMILALSASDLQNFIDSGICERRLKKIRDGNFLHLYQPWNHRVRRAKELVAVPSDARLILFFGMIRSLKGLDLLIDAFASLREEHPDLYLVIAGLPLEDFQPYQEQIDRLGITDRVVCVLRWIPFDEVQEYFGPADLVVLPYRRISFSGVLQIAYAYGKPLVVTNVGGIAEAVSEDETGIVAPTADPQGLAAAIRHLLVNPIAAARMGERGRRLAETKYSWRAVARDAIETYRVVLSRQ